jgi:hypothetical protein
MADKAVRAAVLQPISASRAELLGVHVDPLAAAEAAGWEGAGDLDQQQQRRGLVRQSPGKALRSLGFGQEHDAGGSSSSGSRCAGKP